MVANTKPMAAQTTPMIMVMYNVSQSAQILAA